MSKNNIEDIYTLSPLQEGLLFHSLYPAESDIYLQQLRFIIRGRLDVRAFEHAWQRIIARHTILRTAFVWNRHEKLLQVVRKQVRLPWVELDWRTLSTEEQEEQLAALLKEDRHRGFDLSIAPLLRMTVIRMADESYELYCTLHHLLTDGWSTATLIKELFAFYNAACEGRDLRLENPRPYRDYIQWLSRQDMVEAELFWREMLKGFTAPTPLIGDAAPGNRLEADESLEIQKAWLSPAVTAQLQAMARRFGITLNTLVLGAWAMLLGRYSNEQDVVFGITVSGRPASLPGVEAMVGLFINTLPIRVQLPADARLLPWLEELQSRLLEIREYEYSPLTQVQGCSDVPRGVPLFESMLVFENYPLEVATQDLSRHLESVHIHSIERSNYPLGLVAAPGPKLYLQIGYDSRRFSFETASRMFGHLEAVLESIQTNPTQRLADLSLLTAAERHQLLIAFNETTSGAASGACLDLLFEEQVERTPEAYAVIFEDERLTYRELNNRANQLAHYLRDRNVGPEVHVGICIERSLEMIVGILGILKAGAAYVPIDPSLPLERLSYILEDAHVRLLLTQQSLVDSLPEQVAHVVCLDADWETIAVASAERPQMSRSGDNTAYVIYTSGSTGQPKGVLIPHAGICNTLLWRGQAFSLNEADRILQNLSFAFDASVWQIFGALLNGGQLILARPDYHRDTAYLVETMIEHGITITDFPPSMLRALLNETGIERCSSLRHLFCGGEAMTAELQEKFFAKLNSELHNVYGPTETAVDATCWTCRRKENRQVIPIGSPIDNKQIYLLDAQLQPVPVGVEGEICIGGSGLARGYLNRPAATSEKFIPHPFSTEPGARLYKTGDIARFLPDGNMEFLGRRDQQVKIRGFRIELGEIEAALVAHPQVAQAVAEVLEPEERGEKRLVAYVVSLNGKALTSGELRSYLHERLPTYMIPSAFVKIEAIPLTSNGKVNRRALPTPEFNLEKNDYVAPRTTDEDTLCKIWAKVLRIDKVGIYDNFFELGGDSILSIQVSAQARAAGLARLTPRHLFEHQTVAALADAAINGTSVTAEQGLATGPAPLIPIQHEFFEWGMTNAQRDYQTTLLKLAPEVDSHLLERAAGELIAHHDVLRLRFRAEPDGWKQTYGATVNEPLFSRRDLSRAAASTQNAALEDDVRQVQASLNLEHGPLFRIVEYDLGAEMGRRLLLLAHHLVIDGVSRRILLDDLQKAYEQLRASGQARLPAKTTSFKAWAERLGEYARSKELRQEIPYWLSPGKEMVSSLPSDASGGEHGSGSVRTVSVALSAEETRALLHEVSARQHSQIEDLLLTALIQTCERWTGERSLLVALEWHGREDVFDDVDLSRTVGRFTTAFPVLLRLDEALPPGSALRAIKEQLRRIPQRGLGYGLLRYMSGDAEVAAQLKSLPPAHIGFSYRGHADQTFSDSELFTPAKESGDWLEESEGLRKHLPDVVGEVVDGCLRLNWTYRENVHRRETIERLAAWYVEFLQHLIAHCRSSEAGGYIPSDFPLAGLGQQVLDERIGTKEGIQDLYPLSPMQEGLLFHWLYGRDSKAYFLQTSCRINAPLDATAFLRAWQTVVERHAILRTSFLWDGLPQPLQIVHESVNLEWTEEDWQGLSSVEQAAHREEFLLRDRERGFELSDRPLMRLALMRLGAESYYFSWSTHHILLDGWSSQFVMDEAFAFYEAYSRGREIRLEQPTQYRDYIAWLQRQDVSRAEAFWRHELKGFTEPTRLGIDRGVKATGKEAEYEEQVLSLPEEMTSRLEALARAFKVTLNTVVQGAWGLLLSRYSGTEDVVFGATSSGRTAGPKGIETMVGLFINTLPVRVQVRPEESLRAFLRNLQQRQSRAQEFEFSPLMHVQGWSEAARGRPLFESLLVFQNHPVDASLRMGGSELMRLGEVTGFERTHYPLALTASPGRKLRLVLEYERPRFEREGIARLLSHLRLVLEMMARETDCRVRDLQVLSESEREQMLFAWNQTGEKLPAEKCLSELFAEQARRTPQAIALVCEEATLSYEELEQRANRLARYLKKLGVGPEVLVGLCVERSIEIVVGLLGILKAGGAYVPLDPTYPQERLAYMLEDAQVEVLLTQQRLKTGLPEKVMTLVQLDADWEAIQQESESQLAAQASPLNVAYVIYTSGSTGKPKGVAVPHGIAAAHIETLRRKFGYHEHDRVLQFASLSFDVSLEQIFAPLFSGATVILKDERVWGRTEFRRVAQRTGLTIADLPPAYLLQLMGEDNSEQVLPQTMRLVFCGGDAMPVEAVHRWQQLGLRDVRLVNAYGPTEAVITAAVFAIPADGDQWLDLERVPIGRPLKGRTAYILDGSGNPVPVYVWGELYLGGDCLARGYLNRPAQTAEKFLPDPFSTEAGSRLYRTGDVARYLPDGNIEFLGRGDQQVKIRGFRIELGEIEAALVEHQEVIQAAVLASESEQSEKRLLAYVVRQRGSSLTGGELRSYLQEQLPSYMLPTSIMFIDEIPLTPNGKLDGRALPLPTAERGATDKDFVAPRDFVEVPLVRIWEEVLGVKPIGIKDDFFELGGHSILAVRLMSEIQKQFGRDLPLAILFEKRTVEHLSEALRRQFDALPDSPLVPIQPLGTKRPLFFVHVGSGQVLCYLELAGHLGTDQPFYGLQDTNRYEEKANGSTGDIPIPEMAAYYIAALRAVQPEGPYILGGWSFGGLVAYEMALQLTACGEEVPLLIMLDTATPDFIRNLGEEDDAALLAILAQEMSLPVSGDDLRPLEAEVQLRYVVEQMQKAHLIFEDSRAYLKNQLETFKSRVRVINKYQPQPYSGRIAYFSAGEMNEDADAAHRMSEALEDPTRGFGKIATGSLELYTVPGHHHKIARGESARVLAEMLRARIEREMQPELVMDSVPQTGRTEIETSHG